MSSVPKIIYLQHTDLGILYSSNDDGEWPPTDEGITWCRERIDSNDVEYIRADSHPDAPEPDADLRERMTEVVGMIVYEARGDSVDEYTSRVLAVLQQRPDVDS